MDCVILVGGLGTRLRPTISDVPKPMAKVGNKPFLEYILDRLAVYGARRFILCVSHLRNVIIEHFGVSYKNIPVSYSVEDIPLGTGGAIWQAFHHFSLNDALVVNGDTLLDTDYALFYRKHATESLAMLLTEATDTARYGSIIVEDGKISSFVEKTKVSGPGLINAGVYKIAKTIISEMPHCFSFENDFLAPNLAILQSGYEISRGFFIDIGIPESYSEACRLLPDMSFNQD